MTTVEQATQTILEHKIQLSEEIVPLHLATGKVLREDLLADRDFPPFDRVSMDGIAFAFQAFDRGRRTFKIEGLQAAGAPQAILGHAENCVEIMTGAILTSGADTVVRYEDLTIENGQATINIEDVRQWQNIHKQGTDRKAGSRIVKAGNVISAAEIGVAATIGKTHLKVAKMPSVAIISTGDELVEVGDEPLPHQIRRSNVYNLASAVGAWGLEYHLLHLPDEKEAISKILSDALKNFDALILSGGVSAGKLDFVPVVLEALNVEKAFHKVSQRPGKPFWFGKQKEGAVIFAFPGNPVSSFMCLNRYFRLWLKSSLDLSLNGEKYAVLGKDFYFKPDLTYFLQVKISSRSDGKLVAVPIEGKGSGDLANLVDADAFMELPKGRNTFRAGEVYPILMYR